MKELSSKSGSVEKALQIIECFTLEDATLTLDELSARTDYPKPTVFRMICSLEKFGYIRRAEKKGQMGFQLGMAFLEKGELVNRQIDIRDIARNQMLQLRNETGLSVQLAVRDGRDAVYVEQFESLKHIRVFPQVGRRVPLYAAACPRVLLAALAEEEQKWIVEKNEDDPLTVSSKLDRDQLLKELKQIAKSGYAISRGELYKGTIAIAVPIKNINGNVLAALSLIGVDQDFSAERMDSYIRTLKETVQKIEQELR
jgi:IclR family transcriptional regulator, KDG regulon repressor